MIKRLVPSPAAVSQLANALKENRSDLQRTADRFKKSQKWNELPTESKVSLAQAVRYAMGAEGLQRPTVQKIETCLSLSSVPEARAMSPSRMNELSEQVALFRGQVAELHEQVAGLQGQLKDAEGQAENTRNELECARAELAKPERVQEVERIAEKIIDDAQSFIKALPGAEHFLQELPGIVKVAVGGKHYDLPMEKIEAQESGYLWSALSKKCRLKRSADERIVLHIPEFLPGDFDYVVLFLQGNMPGSLSPNVASRLWRFNDLLGLDGFREAIIERVDTSARENMIAQALERLPPLEKPVECHPSYLKYLLVKAKYDELSTLFDRLLMLTAPTLPSRSALWVLLHLDIDDVTSAIKALCTEYPPVDDESVNRKKLTEIAGHALYVTSLSARFVAKMGDLIRIVKHGRQELGPELMAALKEKHSAQFA